MNPATFYHIYNHANGSENLFRTAENYHFFLKKYALYINPIAETYAYCLMPNHFHFLIKIKDAEDLIASFPTFKTLEKIDVLLSKQFSNLFSSYTQSYNKMYNRKGSLFIKNFKRKEISNESYFTSIIYYIHANAVHHGFVKQIEDWQWTSYHAFLQNKKTQIKRNDVITWFGSHTDFINYHKNQTKEMLLLNMEF